MIISELIKELPELITYIVIGFIFVSVFHFVTYRKPIGNTEHLLVSAIVVGFIGTKIFNAIPINIGYAIDLVGMSLTTAIIALLIGKFYISKMFQKFLDLLGIHRDVYENFWDVIDDPNYVYQVEIKFGNVVYKGFCNCIESYTSKPQIELSRYIKTVDGCAVNDYFNDKTRFVVLDTAKADEIAIVYNKKSVKCKDVALTPEEEAQELETE